jgi:hypothetical protein
MDAFYKQYYLKMNDWQKEAKRVVDAKARAVRLLGDSATGSTPVVQNTGVQAAMPAHGDSENVDAGNSLMALAAFCLPAMDTGRPSDACTDSQDEDSTDGRTR